MIPTQRKVEHVHGGTVSSKEKSHPLGSGLGFGNSLAGVADTVNGCCSLIYWVGAAVLHPTSGFALGGVNPMWVWSEFTGNI